MNRPAHSPPHSPLHPPPVKVVTLAGVDPSGGAGVLADLKTFSALGAYGCGVICALTAQNTRAVTGIEMVDPAFVRLQMETLFDDVRLDAAKIGMLGTAPVIEAVAEVLAKPAWRSELLHRVVDPVMIAKSGDQLLQKPAVTMLREALLPQASVLTPNLPEAGVLLDARPPENPAEMRRAAERLRRLLPDAGPRWILLKGGHLEGAPVDLLHDGDRMIEFESPRVPTRNTHGTGCTLSSAIAALLPQRGDVPTAVADARRYLLGALAAADALAVSRSGEGHGPVHHFHALWKR